jgi:hypothetical protein
LGLQCLQYFDSSDQDSSRQQEGVQENSHFQVCRVAILFLFVGGVTKCRRLLRRWRLWLKLLNGL